MTVTDQYSHHGGIHMLFAESYYKCCFTRFCVHCGVFVTCMRRFLSYTERKKARDMTVWRYRCVGVRSSVCDVTRRGFRPERAAQRNILWMLLFCCSEALIELSIMFHLKLNANGTKRKCKINCLVFLNAFLQWIRNL